jgi:hypothetical protein
MGVPRGGGQYGALAPPGIMLFPFHSNKKKFIENALTQFGRECPRRLKFIFNEKE